LSSAAVACNHLQPQLAYSDERIAAVTATDERVRRLQSVPNVAPVTAADFVAAIDEASRFRRGHEVQAYLGLVPPRTQLETQRQITKAGLEGPVCSGGSAYQTKLGSSPPLWTRQARRVFSRERADGDTLTSSESDMLLTLAAPLIMRVDLPEFDARILAYVMRQDKDAEGHSKRTARGTRHEARS